MTGFKLQVTSKKPFTPCEYCEEGAKISYEESPNWLKEEINKSGKRKSGFFLVLVEQKICCADCAGEIMFDTLPPFNHVTNTRIAGGSEICDYPSPSFENSVRRMEDYSD